MKSSPTYLKKPPKTNGNILGQLENPNKSATSERREADESRDKCRSRKQRKQREKRKHQRNAAMELPGSR